MWRFCNCEDVTTRMCLVLISLGRLLYRITSQCDAFILDYFFVAIRRRSSRCRWHFTPLSGHWNSKKKSPSSQIYSSELDWHWYKTWDVLRGKCFQNRFTPAALPFLNCSNSSYTTLRFRQHSEYLWQQNGQLSVNYCLPTIFKWNFISIFITHIYTIYWIRMEMGHVSYYINWMKWSNTKKSQWWRM